MRKILVLTAAVLLLASLAGAQMMGPGMMAPQQPRGWGWGPGYGMGCWGMMAPGMMMPHGMMGPGMMAPGMMGGGMMWYWLQRPQVQKFLDETVELRKELMLKRFEYFEALRNPDTPAEKLGQLQRDLLKLSQRLYRKLPPALRGWY